MQLSVLWFLFVLVTVLTALCLSLVGPRVEWAWLCDWYPKYRGPRQQCEGGTTVCVLPGRWYQRSSGGQGQPDPGKCLSPNIAALTENLFNMQHLYFAIVDEWLNFFAV